MKKIESTADFTDHLHVMVMSKPNVSPTQNSEKAQARVNDWYVAIFFQRAQKTLLERTEELHLKSGIAIHPRS